MSRLQEVGTNRRRRISVVALVVVAVAGTLVVATQVGEQVRGTRRLPSVAAGTVDHDLVGRRVPPLLRSFVESRLGVRTPFAAEGASPRVAPRRDGGGTRAAGAPQRTVVRHALVNDEFSDAFVIESVPFTASTDMAGASRAADEPDSCARTGPTIWYRYTAIRDGLLLANTVGSSGIISLAIFGEAGLLSCDSDPIGNAQAGVQGSAGETYWFQLTRQTGPGAVTFSLDPRGSTDLLLGELPVVPNGPSYGAALSGDGSIVAFSSQASNLVDEDTNGTLDVFVLDRRRRSVQRVSIGTDGSEGDGPSGVYTAISRDGRYVAFYSFATNLVADDTNGAKDAFVHDRLLGRTVRVSVSSDGSQGSLQLDGNELASRPHCGGPEGPPTGDCSAGALLSISPGGRFVAFESVLSGLASGDERPPATTTALSVFVHDLAAGTTTLDSVATDGTPANDWSDAPVIAAGGRFVAFRSRATNLDGGAVNIFDVFLRDRTAGTTVRISRSRTGGDADDDSGVPAISGDGRFVVFNSEATNVAPEADTNAVGDTFLYDRHTDTIERVSVTSNGEEQLVGDRRAATATGASGIATVSDDGRFVVFASNGANLASDEDTPPFTMDVFVRDRLTGTTSPGPLAPDGSPMAGHWVQGWVSGDGSTFVFAARGRSLTEPDDDDAGRPPYPALDDVTLFVLTGAPGS